VIALVIGVVDFAVQQLQSQGDSRDFCCRGHASKTFGCSFSSGLVVEPVSIATKAD
jgi:hypothetical protein